MTVPNSLTILRIALTPIFLILFFSESSLSKQLSLVVYIVAALTDLYDGLIARKYGYVTRWGKFLDPLADKILSLSALFAFVHINLIDAWLVWVIVVRDVLITLLRSYAEWMNITVATTKTAQAKTFGEYIVIYYILVLSVGKSVHFIQKDFGETIESLLHPQVLFGMMLLVVISTIGTGVQYIFLNRKLVIEIYSKILNAPPSK